MTVTIPTPTQSLTIVSKAWGRQEGYAFFPWIPGDAPDKEARIKSWNEGPAFMWPEDKAKILKHLETHKGDDVYWCPSLFEDKQRRLEVAMDEHALWADLDEVDPRKIQDYPPTIAWESSPGRYQALWIITGGDMQGASWPGGENQRLTYYLGADAGGWDTTQLLRLPGWKNHKYTYREQNNGKPVQGKLLWANGRRYLPDDFNDLPEVQTFGEVQTVLEDEIAHVDRHEVWGRVRLKLPQRARDLFGAREASGDRSEQLWWMMRCLADVGCTVTEIVALVQPTPWNKFYGRHDELRRLTIEAGKAIAARSEEVSDQLEEEQLEVRPDFINLFTLVADVKPPEWLVKDILAVGSCGFIAGQPKSYKSWIALDLLLSVATGIPFLDHFPIRNIGPVGYVQEEDSLPLLKGRLDKVWPGKQADSIKKIDGQLVWEPPDPRDIPRIAAVVRQGITISDPAWQSWLDEQMTRGIDGEPFSLLVIDPLMMVAGEIDENRSQEMTTRIFRPLKQLCEKHGTSIILVHHMKKGEQTIGKAVTRGGQMMLGSTANHAWAEDSMYLRRVRGDVVVERESKHTMGGSFKIQNLRNKGWMPRVVDDRLESPDDEEETEAPQKRTRAQRDPRALSTMRELGMGVHTTKVIAETMGVTLGGARRQLVRLAGAGQVIRVGDAWKLSVD